MRRHRTIMGAALALAGLGTGLLLGSAATAWVMRRRMPPQDPADEAEELLPRSLIAASKPPEAGDGAHRIAPVVTGPPMEENLSPKPKTRVMQFAAAMLIAAILATAAGMVGSARATTNENKKMAAALTGGDPDQGKADIEHYGCASCHTIPGIRGANARVGPPLDQIGERSFVGGVLANTPQNMMHWIENPPVIDSKTAMPNLGVTPTDARDIAAYLYTLR